MSTAALAIKCEELGEDLDTIETLTVSCYRCDPDNPLCVPQKTCPDCKGTGQSPVRFAGIMKEIRESKAELARTGSSTDPDYLEY
jgi:hypothetical protein